MGKAGFMFGMVGLLALFGCNQTSSDSLSSGSNWNTPQSMMTRVARQMQTCWFKQKNPALRPYKMAPELKSYSGKPRILIVPRNNIGGLPKLVAQAERVGTRTQFSTFGPLLETKDGTRLNASLNAWAQGSKTC